MVASGQVHVYAVDGDAPELLYQGGPGGGGVDVGPDGLIYIGSGDVTRINPATEEVSLFSDQLNHSTYGLTVDGDGVVYATSSGLGAQIHVINADGSLGAHIPVPFGSNHRDTALRPGGGLYLASFEGSRVGIFDANGEHLGDFSQGLDTPFGIDVRSNGDIVVTSQNAGEYYVHKEDGEQLAVVDVNNCAGQIRNAAVDSRDHVWLACHSAGRMVRFDADNQEVERFNVNSPQGVAILPHWPQAQ